jgi:Family of unknown function (DUF6204)
MAGRRIMRVTVRGRFSELSAHASEYLRSNQDQHDVSRAEYTADGTLTYDRVIDLFSVRYEIRMAEEDPDEMACARAVGEAELFLRTMGFGYRDLKTVVMDMADVWGGGSASGACNQ